jgi:hypothetical protein
MHAQIKDHLIIITKTMSNLYELIRPLRAKYLGKLIPILILCPLELTHMNWEPVSLFEAIFYLRGAGLEENDLRRAGIYNASRVLVQSDAKKADFEKISSEAEMSIAAAVAKQSIEDSDVIFTYKLIRQMSQKAKIAIEIIHPANVAFLDSDGNRRSKSGNMKYKFVPHFAAGFLFTTSALDSLVCQVYDIILHFHVIYILYAVMTISLLCIVCIRVRLFTIL